MVSSWKNSDRNPAPIRLSNILICINCFSCIIYSVPRPAGILTLGFYLFALQKMLYSIFIYRSISHSFGILFCLCISICSILLPICSFCRFSKTWKLSWIVYTIFCHHCFYLMLMLYIIQCITLSLLQQYCFLAVG